MKVIYCIVNKINDKRYVGSSKDFDSVVEAARHFKIAPVGIINCCKKKKYRKHAAGFIWRYTE